MKKLFYLPLLSILAAACSEKIDMAFFAESLKKDCDYNRAKCDTDFQKLKKEYQPLYIRENIFLDLAIDEKKKADGFVTSTNALLKRDHFTTTDIESIYTSFAVKYNLRLDSAIRVSEKSFFFLKDTGDLRMSPFTEYSGLAPEAEVLAYYLQKESLFKLDKMILALAPQKISVCGSWSIVTHYDLIIERTPDTLFLFVNNFTLPEYENTDSLSITGIKSINKKESHVRYLLDGVLYSNEKTKKGFLLKAYPLSPGRYTIFGKFRFKKPSGEIDRLEFEIPFELLNLKRRM